MDDNFSFCKFNFVYYLYDFLEVEFDNEYVMDDVEIISFDSEDEIDVL